MAECAVSARTNEYRKSIETMKVADVSAATESQVFFSRGKMHTVLLTITCKVTCNTTVETVEGLYGMAMTCWLQKVLGHVAQGLCKTLAFEVKV